ncbi:hypothetical protein [Synechococcus sp. EJ6-Ellesmere]|uniref:hypothetical protein n=1 Tax=Synechococcus sp. EJ6-Ellesmere TaxID=2823734 RepID=UPI0020CC52A1|nr:hypothetical protein [Synechococcus sp. EJ6-Ellesmere]MCP9826759.1 hypothetical protein [Synechococcus sp. EJ6-Ellesmere]
MEFDDPLQFWSIISAAMNENPLPASQINALLQSFNYLGIQLGKQWKPENVNPMIIGQMKKASSQIGDLALGTMPLAGTLKNSWVIPRQHRLRWYGLPVAPRRGGVRADGEHDRAVVSAYGQKTASCWIRLTPCDCLRHKN